ncbi:MAG: cupin domain-containing protein, partial [Planctomycetales bacterium]|nr:cupin domain-containing protein [Planctomycetales bacterium]
LLDNAQTKVMLFAFAAGAGLAEHLAPSHAIIQVLSGEGMLTAGNRTIEAQAGTWLQMSPKTPHSISATTPLVMTLTLFKE